MPSSNEVSIKIVKEVSEGVAPTTGYKEVRTTGSADFGKTIETVQSQELKDTREIADLVLSNFTVDGSAGFEFSPDSHDEIFEGAFFNEFSNKPADVSESGTLSIASNSRTFIFSSGSSLNSSINAGDWVMLSGFATEANNGFYRVNSVSNLTLTFGNVPSNAVSEASDVNRDITLKMPSALKNGAVKQTYTIEEKLNNKVSMSDFQLLTGCVISELELSIDTADIVNGTFNIFGRNSDFNKTSITSDSVQSFTTTPFTSADVLQFLVSGVDTSRNFVSSSTISLTNNVQALNAIGVIGAADVVAGSSLMTVSFTSYFDDAAVSRLAIENSDLSLTYILRSGDNFYVIDLPRVKLSSGGKPSVGTIDDFVTVDAEGTAVLHADYGYQFAIYKF